MSIRKRSGPSTDPEVLQMRQV